MSDQYFSLPAQFHCESGKPSGTTYAPAGAPGDWLARGGAEEHDLNPLSFDFFVAWGEEPTVPDELWLKTTLHVDAFRRTPITTPILTEEFKKFHKTNRADYAPFLRTTGTTLVHKLIPDQADWTQPFEPGRNAARVLSLTSTQGAMVVPQTLQDVIDDISRLRQGATTSTSKRLHHAHSTIECHLSSTNHLWPGDADAVLVNQAGAPQALLEYKKCNKPPRVAEQDFTTWAKDVRKWQSLGLLREKLGTEDKPLPLIVVFYSIHNDDNVIKLQLLKGPYHSLKVNEELTIPRPLLSKPETSTRYVHSLMQLISQADSA